MIRFVTTYHTYCIVLAAGPWCRTLSSEQKYRIVYSIIIPSVQEESTYVRHLLHYLCWLLIASFHPVFTVYFFPSVTCFVYKSNPYSRTALSVTPHGTFSYLSVVASHFTPFFSSPCTYIWLQFLESHQHYQSSLNYL